MKYIIANSYDNYELMDKNPLSSSALAVFKTEDENIISKIKSKIYILDLKNTKSAKVECLNKLYDEYLKVNTLPEITEPLYSSYKNVTDENGNIQKIGIEPIILSIEDLKNNKIFEIKQNLEQEIEIELTNDNFSSFFIEKPKTELELLKEQLSEEIANRESLELALAELSLNLSSINDN